MLWTPPGARGVYGGQVVGQALWAAGSTVPRDTADNPEISTEEDNRPQPLLRSVHCLFLKPGNASKRILYSVKNILDGWNFNSRHVTAIQDGIPIFQCQVSFSRPESASLAFQPSMPDVAQPAKLQSIREILEGMLASGSLSEEQKARITTQLAQPFPVDVRYVDPSNLFKPREKTNKNYIWMRALGDMSDDMHQHRCAAAFMSDWSLASTPLLTHKLRPFSPQVKKMTSLDHNMWFHDNFRADEWLLFEMETQFAGAGRGISSARVFSESGELKMNLVQEAMIRLNPEGTEGKEMGIGSLKGGEADAEERGEETQ